MIAACVLAVVVVGSHAGKNPSLPFLFILISILDFISGFRGFFENMILRKIVIKDYCYI